MKTALVTGATGFIGSNLALELERQGYEVTAVDFRAPAPQNLQGFRGRKLEIDLSHPFKIAGKFEVIFHQAALTDPRFHDDVEIIRANVSGFEHILDLARAHQARLIYASTAGLYGNGPVPMREDQPKECITAYGRSKLQMDERAARLFAEMPIVGLRYFNVFGPRELHKGRPASMIYHLSEQMRSGKRPRIFEHGEQVRDHIYVKDVVSANLCALQAPSGVYNVGTGIGTSFNELVKVLNRVLGTDLPPEYFPMPYDPKTYQSNTVANTTLAKRALGFEAQWKLIDGIRDYLCTLQGPGN